MRLEGKAAVIFGGIQGIGRETVELLLAEDTRVIVADINDELGEKVEKEFQAEYGAENIRFKKCDVANENEVQAIYDLTKAEWGTPEIILNTAAMIDEYNWRRCFDVNIGGVINVTSAALSMMGRDKGGKGGSVVHIASSGALMPIAPYPVYVATKHAVLGFLRSWAEPPHFRRHGVRLNCICPTTVDTPFLELAKFGREEMRQETINYLKKMTNKLRPEDVAKTIINVFKDDSVNGQAVRHTSLGVDYVQFQQHPVQ